jgi:hypothetical protein
MVGFQSQQRPPVENAAACFMAFAVDHLANVVVGRHVRSPIGAPLRQQAAVKQGFYSQERLCLQDVGYLAQTLEGTFSPHNRRRQQQSIGVFRKLLHAGHDHFPNTGRQRHPGHRFNVMQSGCKIIRGLRPVSQSQDTLLDKHL